MFRCKRRYTESRSEAPAGCRLPAAAAPEHNTPGIRLVPGIETDTWTTVEEAGLVWAWSELTL